MLVDCNFKTNILGSFKSHKSRKHRSYSLDDFKPGIVVSATAAHPESPSNSFDDDIGEDAQPGTSAEVPNDLPDIPEHEPAWQILLDLKHIAELVVAPVHSDESIAFLESKVSDHRQRYQEVFPNNKLLPKHHYIEHYSQLIKLFGPLVGLWTMSCFKNVPFSLAVKHQFMIGYHLSSPNIDKPVLEVSDASTVPLELLKEELAQAFKQRNPYASEINLAKNVWSKGIQYRTGMIVAHGSFGGLPEFGEIHQICILQQRLFFVLKLLCGWYCEHYGAFQLTPCPVRELAVVEVSELVDEYPLAAYVVGGVRMVTLKRSICVFRA
ncbi:uncharacterized protein LOC134326197 [Trichomycterus rosablanca]|uniref:uncharacterized protein LOC134326197 n=1 Tax=Trichomycterus rosablanca TaxID=2290929 RepID=UPI002F35130A